MEISELITLAKTRIRYLNEQRKEFERVGDAESIIRIDDELAGTQNTLIRLQIGYDAVFGVF